MDVDSPSLLPTVTPTKLSEMDVKDDLSRSSLKSNPTNPTDIGMMDSSFDSTHQEDFTLTHEEEQALLEHNIPNATCVPSSLQNSLHANAVQPNIKRFFVSTFIEILVAFQENRVPVFSAFLFGDIKKHAMLHRVFENQLLLGQNSFHVRYIS